ncbi:hypothetical protein EMIT053CA3_60036 [Pseudomonas donghuensis]
MELTSAGGCVLDIERPNPMKPGKAHLHVSISGWRYVPDKARFDEFLAQLPRAAAQALKLAHLPASPRQHL